MASKTWTVHDTLTGRCSITGTITFTTAYYDPLLLLSYSHQIQNHPCRKWLVPLFAKLRTHASRWLSIYWWCMIRVCLIEEWQHRFRPRAFLFPCRILTLDLLIRVVLLHIPFSLSVYILQETQLSHQDYITALLHCRASEAILFLWWAEYTMKILPLASAMPIMATTIPGLIHHSTS